jgi:hypothetical protein
LDMLSLIASIAGLCVPLNWTVPVSGGVSLQPASVTAVTTPAIKLHTRRIDKFSRNEFDLVCDLIADGACWVRYGNFCGEGFSLAVSTT